MSKIVIVVIFTQCLYVAMIQLESNPEAQKVLTRVDEPNPSSIFYHVPSSITCDPNQDLNKLAPAFLHFNSDYFLYWHN